MMRSMFSAISGLSAHQTRMDVIGNNIANVNTIGYKASRATFAQTFSQTISGASAPQGGRGGTNPQQIGLGAKLGSIDTILTQGTPESTGVLTDAMIAGDGFFVVSNDPNYTNRFYTRAGNFNLDSVGNLHLNGNLVLGYRVTSDSFGTSKPVYETELKGLVIDKSSTAPPKGTGVSHDGTPPDGYPAITESGVTFGGNLDAGMVAPADYDLTEPGTQATFATLIGKAGGANVSDLPAEAIAKDFTYDVYDELGGKHEIRMLIVKGGAGDAHEWYMAPVAADGSLGATIGTDVIGFNFVDGKPSPSFIAHEIIPVGGASGDYFPNGAISFMYRMDISALTNYDNDSTVQVTNREGYKSGGFERFEIGADGIITAVYSNGVMSPIGRLAIANFTNPAGLSNQGGNLFGATPNSGIPNYGGPGQPGFAMLMPGNIEMSNVDLSREFTNMIITQRGFQANSRIISSTDEMLQELVNLKR